MNWLSSEPIVAPKRTQRHERRWKDSNVDPGQRWHSRTCSSANKFITIIIVSIIDIVNRSIESKYVYLKIRPRNLPITIISCDIMSASMKLIMSEFIFVTQHFN